MHVSGDESVHVSGDESAHVAWVYVNGLQSAVPGVRLGMFAGCLCCFQLSNHQFDEHALKAHLGASQSRRAGQILQASLHAVSVSALLLLQMLNVGS